MSDREIRDLITKWRGEKEIAVVGVSAAGWSKCDANGAHPHKGIRRDINVERGRPSSSSGDWIQRVRR